MAIEPRVIDWSEYLMYVHICSSFWRKFHKIIMMCVWNEMFCKMLRCHYFGDCLQIKCFQIFKFHKDRVKVRLHWQDDWISGTFFPVLLRRQIRTIDWLIDWLINWLDSVLRRIGNILPMLRWRLLVKCDQFWHFEVSLTALTSLLFIEIQRNGLLRAKGVIILDTGHHLTSHPTDITV